MAVWIVRGGSRWGDAEQDFLQSGSVGIYFGVDRTMDGMSDAVLRGEIRRSYIREVAENDINYQPGVVTYYLNQVLAFRDAIQPGDTIIMPRKASGGHTVARGIVDGEYEYWPRKEYGHRRRVQWLEDEIPREDVGLEWYSSDQRTVFRVDELG